MRGVPLVAIAIVACGGGPAERHFALDPRSGQSLVGAWDAKLSLSQPYQLELREPKAKRICGTIGFVENRFARASFDTAGNLRHMGVYDLDLSLLGLDWLDDRSFPAAVASAVDGYAGRASLGRDSVRIVFESRSPGTNRSPRPVRRCRNQWSMDRTIIAWHCHWIISADTARWPAQSTVLSRSGCFLEWNLRALRRLSPAQDDEPLVRRGDEYDNDGE
jgi:hypothetical protein